MDYGKPKISGDTISLILISQFRARLTRDDEEFTVLSARCYRYALNSVGKVGLLFRAPAA